MSQIQIWRQILLGLGVILLICAIKSYLLMAVIDTQWCVYLCPSPFEWLLLGDLPVFDRLFGFQHWLQITLQGAANWLVADPWNIFTILVFAPLIEEAIYRGPLFLARRHSQGIIWWLTGIVLTILFALSHGRSGLALLPLLAVGLCSLWLIASTRKFWPVVVLHSLYNFFALSVTLNQSIWVSD